MHLLDSSSEEMKPENKVTFPKESSDEALGEIEKYFSGFYSINDDVFLRLEEDNEPHLLLLRAFEKELFSITRTDAPLNETDIARSRELMKNMDDILAGTYLSGEKYVDDLKMEVSGKAKGMLDNA